MRTITSTPEAGRLVVHFPDLGVSGTVQVYCGEVTSVSRNGSSLRSNVDYVYDSDAKRLTVPFQGVTDLSIQGVVSLFETAVRGK